MSGSISRDDVLGIVRNRLAEILEIEPAGIGEGDSFQDDLDADSLALIELVEAIEEELGERSIEIRIEDDDLEDLKTCLLYTSPSPRDATLSRMPSSA